MNQKNSIENSLLVLDNNIYEIRFLQKKLAQAVYFKKNRIKNKFITDKKINTSKINDINPEIKVSAPNPIKKVESTLTTHPYRTYVERYEDGTNPKPVLIKTIRFPNIEKYILKYLPKKLANLLNDLLTIFSNNLNVTLDMVIDKHINAKIILIRKKISKIFSNLKP